MIRSDKEQAQLILTVRANELDLAVPYKDSQLAKRLGALWDGEDKVWYVPAGMALEPFAHWFLDKHGANIRASSYYIIQNIHQCWKCKAILKVYGFMMPRGHEVIVNGKWQMSEQRSIISFVDFIPETVQMTIAKLTSDYRYAYYKSGEFCAYVNHCHKCKMKQSDNSLYHEMGGAFDPSSEQDASLIVWYHINEPFKAQCASYSLDVPYFHLLRRAASSTLDMTKQKEG